MKQLNMLGVRRQFFRSGGVRRLRGLRLGDDLLTDSSLMSSAELCQLQSSDFAFYHGTKNTIICYLLMYSLNSEAAEHCNNQI